MMLSVRLADVAHAAHVSVSTVSKALADSPEIGIETKLKIRQLAESMGYQSNTLARSLRLGKSSLLGVIVPNTDNPYYSGILQSIAEKARENDYTVIIATSNEKVEDEIAAVRSLLSIPVAGILAVPVDLKNYERVQLPLVFLSRFPYRQFSGSASAAHLWNKSFSFVVNDDYEGQRIATNTLAERGIEDLYILLDTNNQSNVSSIKTFARLDGYKQALKEHNLHFEQNRVFFNINTIEACYNAVLEICAKKGDAPIGICIVNDYFSIGAINAINKCALTIPEQVAIVGYDDIEMARYFSPPLTTIHVANKELGRYGTVQIFDMINGDFDSKQNISTVLTPYLEKRQST